MILLTGTKLKVKLKNYNFSEFVKVEIVIYSKLKLRLEEISVLERAITFFSKLKEKQLEYVNFLAQKYGMVDKAQEYISQNKKIYYYLGAFELYNPQVTRLK